MNYKYYYTSGLFDVVRRHEKNILARLLPEFLHTVALEEPRRCDSLFLIRPDHPITTAVLYTHLTLPTCDLV